MSRWQDPVAWRAAAAAALLLATGGVLGVTFDRLWLSRPTVERSPLTADAMAAELGLTPADEAHLEALLDSLHPLIRAAVQQGPDSLRATVHAAQLRIEAVLPADARPGFRAWIREHHEQIARTYGIPTESGTSTGSVRGGSR